MPLRALLAPFVLSLALAPAPASAAVASDTTPPSIVAPAVDPATVDVSTGPVQVVVSAWLADPAGVGSATVALGSAAPVALAPLDAEATGGTWTAALAVPAGTPYGPLGATLVAVDTTGNAATQDLTLTVADAVPAPPASVGVSGTTVFWTAPPPNGGSPVEGYDITVTAADQPPVALTAAADATSLPVAGLAAGVTYEVAVAARNAAGAGRPALTTTLAGAVAEAPANVTATPGDGTIDVAWAPVAGSTGYTVVAAPATGSPVTSNAGPAATTARLAGLADGTAYAVSVSAVGPGGTGPAATAQATPRTVPGAPTGVVAKAGDARASVSWTAPASDGGAQVTAYRVAGDGQTWTLPATARNATVGPLRNGVTTAFTVAAVNVAGAGAVSAASNPVTPRRPVRLDVVVQPASRVQYGKASRVTAAVTTTTGAAVPGDRVELLARRAGSSTWRRVASGTTGATGRVALAATLPANSSLVLRHPLGADVVPNTAVRSVGVAPRVSAAPSAKTIRLGHTLVVKGAIAPGHPTGQRVRLQKLTPSGWETVANGLLTSPTTYTVKWHPGRTAVRTLRVIKPADADHVTGSSASWRQAVAGQNVADVAHDILSSGHIALDNRHVSGVVDLATAKADVQELAAGQLARRSAYQNAPGGSTSVDVRLLTAVRAMAARGTVTVTEIAGGSHAPNSRHYYGKAVDIRVVNGVPVRPGSGYGWVVDVCRAYGSAHQYYPAYDPYGGHQNHVHCDW